MIYDVRGWFTRAKTFTGFKVGLMLGDGEVGFFSLFVIFALMVIVAIGANMGWFGPMI